MAREGGVAGMLKLSAADFGEIRTWMHRNTRPLEMALWVHLFEAGIAAGARSDADSGTVAVTASAASTDTRSAVWEALSHYRNADGGFGNALEPDSWNPASSPYTTLKVLDLLDGAGMPPAGHPLVQGILRYIETCPHATADGWPFSIPTNDDHPHAPWWTFDPKANEFEHIGVTTGLCAYILRLAPAGSPLHTRAVTLANKWIEQFLAVANFGEMGLGGFCQLYEAVRNTGMEAAIPLGDLQARLRARITASIEYDTNLWMYHKVRPSWYIRTPDSPWLPGNEAILETELDYLVRTRPANGVWDIDWSWFDNNDRYPKAFAISENWWKGWCAIEKLTLLRRFGRIEAD